MDTIDIKIDTRELERALKALPEKLRESAMRKALQAGGDVMLEAYVEHAPERTDEPTPGSDSLPPGILKADIRTEIQLGNGNRNSRIKVGPGKIAARVARWQNNGWNLTTHGSKGNRRVIKAIPGKHFIEAAFDESSETAVDVFCATLGEALFGTAGEGLDTAENDSHDVEFG